MGEVATGRRRVWWGVVPAVAAVGAAIGFRAVFPAAPNIDPAMERKVLPVVRRYVLVAPLGPLIGYGVLPKGETPPKGFCTERLIEIRPAGTGLRVGFVAWCGYYARHGDHLDDNYGGGIYAGALTVSPASAPARVSDVTWEPDDSMTAWAAKNFSPGGAAEVQRVVMNVQAYLTDPAVQARAAFGLPAKS